jgi:hypothetical protein
MRLGTGNVRSLNVAGSLIIVSSEIRRILEKQDGVVQTGYIWIMIRCSEGLL